MEKILRVKMKIFQGCPPQPNFKVFFIAISRIEEARMLNFGMQLAFDLIRGLLPNSKVKVFFIAFLRIGRNVKQSCYV